MIDSITDYENWRDSLQDRPMPDTNGPDERAYRFYSHDYPADTTLEYTRSGNRAELKLSFSSGHRGNALWRGKRGKHAGAGFRSAK